MKKLHPITGLTLEGFQVFEKQTYIPLEGLTLLFGPNSSGKSAVQDAIELYRELLNSRAETPSIVGNFGDSNVMDLLERHWRRTGGDNSWATKLSLGVHHVTSCGIATAVAAFLGRELLDDPEFERVPELQLESRWHFVRTEDDDDENLSFDWDFEFYIESELLVSYVGTAFCVNLEHPALRSIPRHVDFSSVGSAHPEEVSFVDGYFVIDKGVTGFRPSGYGFQEENSHWLRYLSLGFGYDTVGPPEKPLLRAAIAELGLLVGSVLRVSQSNSNFSPTKVAASRVVPVQGDLTFEIGDLYDTFPRAIRAGDEKYKPLAESLAADLTNPPYPPLADRKKYAENVNRALSDDLFLENGYQLDYDFRVLMSKANSQAAIDGAELDQNEFGYCIDLFLRDGAGRKHLFEDVGSGIGYVLPVLCATFNPSPHFSTCFIQQPELHIHPALQAAMGDVFIKGRSTGKQVLLETHSEHLLLRILKRIRQTHLQANIAQELKVNAEDVCVLYFNPSPDGTTTVKRLRVTEDGEFMDRWPRGFFAERDQELLDE